MTALETPSSVDEEKQEDLSAWKHYTILTIGQYNVPCEALELRLAIELDRERPRQYQPLIQSMQRHGADVELARRALKAKGIAKDRAENILARIEKTSPV